MDKGNNKCKCGKRAEFIFVEGLEPNMRYTPTAFVEVPSCAGCMTLPGKNGIAKLDGKSGMWFPMRF